MTDARVVEGNSPIVNAHGQVVALYPKDMERSGEISSLNQRILECERDAKRARWRRDYPEAQRCEHKAHDLKSRLYKDYGTPAVSGHES